MAVAAVVTVAGGILSPSAAFAAPATRTWTGLGADGNWTTPANWDTVPVAGDDLVFPDIPDGARHAAVNDFAAGTSFNSITIDEQGYVLSGNSLTVAASITSSSTAGTSTISAAVALASAALPLFSQTGGTLTLSGSVSGSRGIAKTGGGTVLLSVANTYSGVTSVLQGNLAIANSSALGSSSVGNGTVVASGATLDIRNTINSSEPVTISGTGAGGVGALFNGSGNNVVQTVTLAADSRIAAATGTFMLIPSTLAQSGGSFALTKSGAGTLDVLATASYTGGTIVSAGVLAVEGTVPGSVAVLPGGNLSIAGGNVGNVTVLGGTLSAGFSTSPFVSDANSVMLDSASTFVAQLNGAFPSNGSTGYSQLIAAGGATLGGATLSVSIGGGYTPAAGDALTILSTADGVTGTFAGLPEGGYVLAGAGRAFRITYQGGTGNDVVLRSVADTTTTVSSSVNPSTVGQSVTLTATVASGTVPTGDVAFFDGTTSLGTATMVSGVASFTTSSLALGSHTITAAYAGSTSAAPSKSAALTQVVGSAASTTTLSSSANPSTSGQSVTFSADVTSASGTPTGTVTFSDGATVLATEDLVDGSASLSTSALTAGTHALTAAYNGDGAIAPSTSGPFTQTVNEAPVFTADAPPAVVSAGVAFSYQFAATGFPEPTFAVTAGALPDGVTLSESGLLSGTVLTGGVSTFTVTASNDVAPDAVGASHTLSATEAPVFTADAPPTTVTAGVAISYQFAATGYPAPTFEVSAGALPDGLALSASGLLTGTLEPGVSSAFTVTASNDVAPDAVGASHTITATASPVFTADAPPAALATGVAFSYQFAASGYPAPVFSVADGDLPTGLELTPGGLLSGTPTVVGEYSFTVRANNSTGTADAAIAISVGTAPAVSASAGARPTAATVGSPYSFTVPATGTGPLRFAVTSSALPAGLSLNATTGVISGTPTQSVTSRFVVTVSSPFGATTVEYTITAAAVAVEVVQVSALAATGLSGAMPAMLFSALALVLGAAAIYGARRRGRTS